MNPFVGEVRVFGFNFAPVGWAQCNGQILPISQNTALFSILGTFYGGNGTSNFALPNLQDSITVGTGQGPGLQSWSIAEFQGSSTHTLLLSEMPAHTHPLVASTGARGSNVGTPTTSLLLDVVDPGSCYVAASATPNATLAPQSMGVAGQGQAHNNLQPCLALNFCIALVGVFPTRA